MVDLASLVASVALQVLFEKVLNALSTFTGHEYHSLLLSSLSRLSFLAKRKGDQHDAAPSQGGNAGTHDDAGSSKVSHYFVHFNNDAGSNLRQQVIVGKNDVVHHIYLHFGNADQKGKGAGVSDNKPGHSDSSSSSVYGTGKLRAFESDSSSSSLYGTGKSREFESDDNTGNDAGGSGNKPGHFAAGGGGGSRGRNTDKYISDVVDQLVAEIPPEEFY